MPDVRIFRDLEAAAADAVGTLDRGARASLFDRLDWYRLTLAHCPPAGRLLILRAGDDWLFLMVDRRRAAALASWYTLRLDNPGPGAEAIARALRAHVDTLALAPLADAEPLAAAFARAGWRVALTRTTVNWRTAPQDWASWWAARPGRLRETVRRKGRGDPFLIGIRDRFDADDWRHYETVYARSWKPAEGAPAFLRALAVQEGAAGTLRLGLAFDGDRPVAAQLWLVEHGRATIHKLAHDAADDARSPGTLLSHALFRHVIAVDRVREIDFGTGDDAYKADWMDTAVPLYRLDAWNPARLAGRVGHARHVAGALVRRYRSR